MSKHIELAKKLKALADRGVGGEKINAEMMLNALMKKHNITIEDIEGEKLEDYYFSFDKSEHSLWLQIVKTTNRNIKCYGEFPEKVIKEFELKGNYMITCSASDFIEIEAKHDFYKSLYKEELDVFYTAFLSANKLFFIKEESEEKEMTEEEYRKWKRIAELSAKITIGKFRKQLSKTV